MTAKLVRIGDANQVADGEMRVFDLEGTMVNVTNMSGHLYAFDDTCTHMGCSLANGTLDGTTVTCVCHGSQFDIASGAVLRGPPNGRSGPESCRSKATRCWMSREPSRIRPCQAAP